ncbi:hypothetical protein H311_03607, partial [Anncaliia algerae PRA109]
SITTVSSMTMNFHCIIHNYINENTENRGSYEKNSNRLMFFGKKKI